MRLTVPSVRAGDFGATGPADVNNHQTMTQSFTSKLHKEVHPSYYPRELKVRAPGGQSAHSLCVYLTLGRLCAQNWYSDDWIHHVYDDARSSFLQQQHRIRNQNAKGASVASARARHCADSPPARARTGTRYLECRECKQLYYEVLAKGKQRTREYLESRRITV